MKMLTIVAVLVSVAAVAFTARGLFRDPDLAKYYPPTLHPVPQFRSITIPVEIEKKGDKASFVELFNVYGFSGNGPSIEQVVKANTKIRNVSFDSEGDAFVVVAPDQDTYLSVLKELETATQIESLNVWLRKSVWIPIKE